MADNISARLQPQLGAWSVDEFGNPTRLVSSTELAAGPRAARRYVRRRDAAAVPALAPTEINLPTLYETMCRAIDACFQLDEVAEIRNRALALAVYAREAGNLQAERRAAQVRLRAERKAGMLSAKLATAPGKKKTNGPRAKAGVTKHAQLAALGISDAQARRWERLARVPQQAFEAGLAGTKPTRSNIIRAAGENPLAKDAAFRLWRRVRAFARDEMIEADPAEVLAGMTSKMAGEVRAWAPGVAAWLSKITTAEIRPCANLKTDQVQDEKRVA